MEQIVKWGKIMSFLSSGPKSLEQIEAEMDGQDMKRAMLDLTLCGKVFYLGDGSFEVAECFMN